MFSDLCTSLFFVSTTHHTFLDHQLPFMNPRNDCTMAHDARPETDTQCTECTENDTLCAENDTICAENDTVCTQHRENEHAQRLTDSAQNAQRMTQYAQRMTQYAPNTERMNTFPNPRRPHPSIVELRISTNLNSGNHLYSAKRWPRCRHWSLCRKYPAIPKAVVL